MARWLLSLHTHSCATFNGGRDTLRTTVVLRISFKIEVTLPCTFSYAHERPFKHRQQSNIQLKIRTLINQLDQTTGEEVSAQHDTTNLGVFCLLYLKLQGIAGAV